VTATKREKWFAAGVGAVLLVYVGYTYVVSPYLQQRAQLMTDIKVAQDQYKAELRLLENRGKVATEWKALLAGTLQTTSSDAGSKTQDALYDWAGPAGFDLQGVGTPSALQVGDFQHAHMKVQGVGSESNVARWLWAIENSKYPLKIDDVLITPRKEGTDDLAVQVGLTALVFAPPAAKSRPDAARSAATGEVK